MKKQYTTPESEIFAMIDEELICASARFGEGTTDVMHSKQRDIFSDEDNYFGDEYSSPYN